MSGCSVQCLCGSVACVWQRDWFMSNLLVQYLCCRRCFSCLIGPGIAWQLQCLCRTLDRGPYVVHQSSISAAAAASAA